MFGSLIARNVLPLVLDEVAVPQTDLLQNLGVPLESQVLLKEQVAAMARRAFAYL